MLLDGVLHGRGGGNGGSWAYAEDRAPAAARSGADVDLVHREHIVHARVKALVWFW